MAEPQSGSKRSLILTAGQMAHADEPVSAGHCRTGVSNNNLFKRSVVLPIWKVPLNRAPQPMRYPKWRSLAACRT